MRKDRRYVALLAQAALLSGLMLAATSWSNAADDAVTGSQLVMPESHELTGRVLFSDAKTPAAKTFVRVRSGDKNKVVQELKTDEKGNFKLRPGSYTILFHDTARVNMHVVPGNSPEMGSFTVVLPKKAPPPNDQIPQPVSGEGKDSAAK
jgi:hypothetical protein